jgi:hypothetical protein
MLCRSIFVTERAGTPFRKIFLRGMQAGIIIIIIIIIIISIQWRYSQNWALASSVEVP